jgi:hypothetical protein
MTRPLLGLLALTTVLVIGCGSTPEGDPNPPATAVKPAPVTTGGASATATTAPGSVPEGGKPTESKLTVPGINPPAPTGGTGVTSGETKAGEVAPKKPGPDPVDPTSGQGL